MATWDRLGNESAQAYDAFRLYLQLGADRSLDAVSQKLAKSIPLLKRWSSLHGWVLRAEDYDRHLADIEQEKREQAVAAEADKWAARRAEHRENAWALAQGMAIAAAQALQQFDPTAASASEIARLAEASDKLARLAAEMATDNQRLTIDVASLTDEELESLRDELRKQLRSSARG